MDQFKRSAVSDPFYSDPLPCLEDLPPNPPLKKNFDSSSLKFSDFQCVLTSRSSSPGLNQIPYKVYKHCPHFCLTFLSHVVIVLLSLFSGELHPRLISQK